MRLKGGRHILINKYHYEKIYFVFNCCIIPIGMQRR